MRIFIGPVEIAGVAKGLARGFAEIGISATVVLSVQHPYAYNKAHRSLLLSIWQKLGTLRLSTSRDHIFQKIGLVVLHKLWSWLVLMWAVFKFDAFIFLYGRTITDSIIELIFLRWLRRKIIFINVGTDSRPPYVDGINFPATDMAPNYLHAMHLSRKYKKKISRQERYGSYLINSPSSGHFHEQPYINWFSLGAPISINRQLNLSRNSENIVRILHSPSNPIAKGTQGILDAIQSLIDKGYSIQFVKLEGVNNEKVLEELQLCDFVVDQLYSDIPMAIFAAEAACFGKPAIVGGYLAEDIRQYIQIEDLPPSLYVLPEQIEAAIERLVIDVEYRKDLGERARAFITQRWSCAAVAARYQRLMTDDVPDEWLFYPNSITYVHGFGMPETQAIHMIRELINRYGVESLQVSDKPKLEAAFIQLSLKGLRGKNA